MKLKAVETLWFSGKVTIGIVAGKNEEIGYWRAFIGSCSGFDEELDTQEILDWGSPVKEDLARRIFPDIEGVYKE